MIRYRMSVVWSEMWIGFFFSFLVFYRWWRDAQESTSRDSDKKRGVLYTATQGTSYGGPMKIINNIFNSDLVFNLRREEEVSLQNGENGEVGVSGRDYALVPGEMWLQALKWSVFQLSFGNVGIFIVNTCLFVCVLWC